MDQRTRVLLAAVVGAGVVIGTAGVFLYQQLYNERRRLLVQEREIHKLDETVAELKAELRAVQSKQRTKRSVTGLRRSRSISTVDTESDFDMYSAVGTDDEDDEFFDISDDEEKYNAVETDDPVLGQLFATSDVLMSGSSEDKRAAHAQLLGHVDAYPDSAALHWRLAKSCSGMANVYTVAGDLDNKKAVVTQGLEYAMKALRLDPASAEAHKWYAVLIGTRGEFQGMKEKIEDGYVFKEHVDKALALSPKDASLHHLLGRFKYEVATLSWIERKLASTLFAEPPSSSLAEAIADFERAELLSRAPWKENRLLLAKCHLGQGDYASAVKWLDSATQVDVKTPDDETAHKEAQTLSSKYSSYRNSL